jgi:hypothetical protein
MRRFPVVIKELGRKPMRRQDAFSPLPLREIGRQTHAFERSILLKLAKRLVTLASMGRKKKRKIQRVSDTYNFLPAAEAARVIKPNLKVFKKAACQQECCLSRLYLSQIT